MRLLLDLQGAQGGSRHSGLGRYSLEFARALAAARGGHEVLLLLNAAQAESAAALAAEFEPLIGGANIHHFTPPTGCAAGQDPHHPLRLLAEQIRAQAILALAPDMVHLGSVFEGWNEPLVTNWPAELPRPRHAATLHDLIPLTRRAEYLEGPWREAGLVPWYMRQLLELGTMDGLLCNSEATRQEGLHHLDMPLPERILHVGGGVADGFFAASRGPAPVAGRYILCLGLNDIRKNEARLIAAMGLLPEGLRDGLRLVVTGSIPAGHLERLAREAGLAEGTILHLGFVEDAVLPALYANASLFIIASLAEGFGLPLAEAMACGAPFAASRVGALPELAGRDDVLFDPLDIADMARVIGRILGDGDFADALRAYGPGQAARHSWSSAAIRGWAALEAWAGPAHAPRPALVLTGPLPPQESGIADYTAELLPALAQHYAITLVSEQRPMEGIVAGFPWLSPAGFAAQPYAIERVVHQLGNSALHHFQHRHLLPLRPAVSVLHDIAMPEYRRWAATQEPAPETALLASLYANHGYPALLAALEGDAQVVAASLPMSAQVVESSLATIVHSAAAQGMLRDAYGPGLLRDVHVVPHLRRLAGLPGREAARARLGLTPEALVVASFGACVPKKLPLRLIEAFARAGLGADARLVFVGKAQPGLDDVVSSTARAQGLSVGLSAHSNRQVRITGTLNRADYEDWLAAADIAVQLRGRHQGETSGAVIDALAARLACIVNARGSMAEFPPETVLRLDETFSDPELVAALQALAGDSPRRRRLGEAGQGFVVRRLRPSVIAAAYRDVIEAAQAAPGLRPVLAAAARLPALAPASAMALGDALAASFPLLRQGRVFITEGSGWRRDDFRDHHAALRPEPMRWQGGGWMTDHAGLARGIGLARVAAPERPVNFHAGDAVVTDGEIGAIPDAVRRIERARRG